MTTLVEELEQAANRANCSRTDATYCSARDFAGRACSGCLLAARLRQRAAWVREQLKEPHPDVMEFVPCDKCVARPALLRLTGPIPSETATAACSNPGCRYLAVCYCIGRGGATAGEAKPLWCACRRPGPGNGNSKCRAPTRAVCQCECHAAGEAKPACICPFPRLYCPMSCSNHACPACEGEKRRAAIAELKARP